MILLPNHPLLLLSTELNNLCKPLDLIHVNHFTYLKQFNDGSRVSLSNKPEWIEDYYKLNLYNSSLFEQKPSEYKSEFNIWIGDYDLDVYRHGRLYYNTAHSITITEPQHNSCEHFLFSTAPEHQQAIQYLANNMDILYHFIAFIKDRGAHIFKSANNNKIAIPKPLEDSTEWQKYIDSKNYYAQMQQAKKLFLKATPIHRYKFESGDNKGIQLTQREITCVTLLLKNKTAAETADIMNISRRTVESYLDNIRFKLNCNSKIELINLFLKSKFLTAL